MTRRTEVVVVGAGLMGAATAWQLARRGHGVTLIEAYGIGHRRGSSHGTSRIFRRAYADPFYVELTGRAEARWRELEDDTGTALLRTTGGLDLGAERDPAGLAAVLGAAGVECALLGAWEAAERWPFIHFDGPALYHPRAGVIDADAAVAASVRRAAALGAEVLTGTRVRGIAARGDGRAAVRIGEGEAEREGAGKVRGAGREEAEIVADAVVVAAGAWLPELAPEIGVPGGGGGDSGGGGGGLGLPPLTVTQQQVFHFAQRDPGAAWPVLVAKDALQLFGLPSGADGGPVPAVKVAQHNDGTPTSATARSGVVDPVSRATVARWVARSLPGLDPRPVAESTCLYTTTPDEDFVLDRVGPVVVVSPCSGHGAKFAPLIGAMAADLALGEARAHPRFALRRGLQHVPIQSETRR
ncbi:FAD-dependent oxidoreductase [Streptomyces sp. NPDC093085]|uniref:FAD-dependent oxidoreductase n=1 Tax=Streptomyces sp. NPDC093085 TaxID=3155068 RepID=UPI00342DCDD1